MSELANRIVQELWSYCHVLRDEGLSYQSYLERLTFLLFLKMADERAALTGEPQPIPEGYRWADLATPHMEGGTGAALHRNARRARAGRGNARSDLRKGSERDSRPGKAASAHRRADRQRALVSDVG